MDGEAVIINDRIGDWQTQGNEGGGGRATIVGGSSRILWGMPGQGACNQDPNHLLN